MRRAIIVDIDGTITNCEHRQPFLHQKPKDWKSFHAGCHKDTLNGWCATLINKFKGTHAILLVSGRIAETEGVTREWLWNNCVWYDVLHMREPGDFRDDTVFKKEVYEQKIKGRYDVEFVVDDRKRLAEMWRGLGLVCLHCAEGNF